MKATVAFRDEALYRAIRLRAAQDGRQIRDVIEEALRAWLEAREEEEDVEAARYRTWACISTASGRAPNISGSSSTEPAWSGFSKKRRRPLAARGCA